MNYTKVCSKCQEEKPATSEFFGRKTREKDGFNCYCKPCQRLISRERYQSNKDYFVQYAQVYREKNREALIKYSNEYYQENKEKLLSYTKRMRKEQPEKHREYRRKYRAKNSVIESMRSGLRACIYGIRKQSHTMDYVGCSIDDLKFHLQSQFQPGMTWENYGRPDGVFENGWHIDHIRPLASFNFRDLQGEKLESALHEAWHYSNLQPLWGLDNVLKGGTWTHNHEPVESSP